MKAFKQTIDEISVKTGALEQRKAAGKPVHESAVALKKELKEGWRASGAGSGPSKDLGPAFEKLEAKLTELSQRDDATRVGR